MTTTAPTFRRLAVGLGAAVLLGACGARFSPPAAVVAGHRITETDLATELDLLAPQPAGQASPDAAAESSRKDVVRRVLLLLIELHVAQTYADAHGISVSTADVDRALEDTIRSVGGQDAFDQELRNRNLTVGAVRRSLQHQVLFQKVQAAVVARVSGSADQAAQDFQRWFQEQLTAADVEVNPRFGRFDPATGDITPIRSTAG